MGGGLMQLVAYGAQDVYLTGNPQITFWKVTYRRYTNFAVESIEQTFNGQADFGRRVTCTISRNGDLAYRTYLQVTLPQIQTSSDGPTHARWLDYPGEQIISCVEVEIGGQRIDRQYGDWMHIWNQLTITASQKEGYNKMVGNTTALTYVANCCGSDVEQICAAGNTVCGNDCVQRNALPTTTLYIPLQFWYCSNPGLAIPLIALQYHEVKIVLEMNYLENMLWAVNAARDAIGRGAGHFAKNESVYNSTCLVCASLYVDYVFLDTDERRRMAQNPHEYLIEQLQFTGDQSIGSSSNKIQLNFNHPCKELIWVVQPQCNVDYCAQFQAGSQQNMLYGAQPFNYTDQLDNLPRAAHNYRLDLADSRGPFPLSKFSSFGQECIGPYCLPLVDVFATNAKELNDIVADMIIAAAFSDEQKHHITVALSEGDEHTPMQKVQAQLAGKGTLKLSTDQLTTVAMSLVQQHSSDQHSPAGLLLSAIMMNEKYDSTVVDALAALGGSFGIAVDQMRSNANAFRPHPDSWCDIAAPFGGAFNATSIPANNVRVPGGQTNIVGDLNAVMGGKGNYPGDAPVPEVGCNSCSVANCPNLVCNPAQAVAAVVTKASRHETCAGDNPVVCAKLLLNGQDRFSERLGSYFDLVQPFQHHTSTPSTGINVYSFALRPEEHQPSGTCNFSRIDNASIQMVVSANTVRAGGMANVRVYATNYNVLRIMSGMGGLAYSN